MPLCEERLLMVPTIIAGVIGLIIIIRTRPRLQPVPVRVRATQQVRRPRL